MVMGLTVTFPAQTTSVARDGAFLRLPFNAIIGRRTRQTSRCQNVVTLLADDENELLYKCFIPWMAQVRRLAPRYGYRIEKGDEAWEEWFWLYYYLDGYSPKAALVATRKHDRQKRGKR
jgi:hypothetical protein